MTSDEDEVIETRAIVTAPPPVEKPRPQIRITTETVSPPAGFHEPASFDEKTSQIHFKGQTYSVAVREYLTGATTVRVRMTSDVHSGGKEFQVDLEGAVKLNQLLTSILQKVAMERAQKARPIARINGHSLPLTEASPAPNPQA
jgi:hypothetical protein